MSVQLIFSDCWGKLTKKKQNFKGYLNNFLDHCKNHESKINCNGFNLKWFLTYCDNPAHTPHMSVGTNIFQHILK